PDRRARAKLREPRARAGKAAAVELVVAGDVERRASSPRRPRHRLRRPGEVAGEDEKVGAGLGEIESRAAQMQIGDDVESHLATLTGKKNPLGGVAGKGDSVGG